MANKNHRQGFKTGLLVKAGEAFKNIYKTNKKKQNVVDQLNKNLEKQRKKTGPYFDRLRAKEKKLKKLKGKK